MKKILFTLIVSLMSNVMLAQQYNGTEGLIHVPSADMDEAGTARAGAHFLNSEFTPDNKVFYSDGQKYGTYSAYLSITPFKWIQISYDVTLLKQVHHSAANDKTTEYNGKGFREKDQYFSVKLQPLREQEGKWWPSVAIGGNDFWDSHSGISGNEGAELYFGNLYLAMSKHFSVKNHCIGAHLAYRYYRRSYNKRYQGIVGGVTYNPSFYKPLRFIAEWTGDDINIGADCLLWNHLLVQASLQNGKYFTGGLCYKVNLFGKKKQ